MKKIPKEKLTDQVVDNLVLAMKYITDTSMKEEGLYRISGVSLKANRGCGFVVLLGGVIIFVVVVVVVATTFLHVR